jgi:ferritin-like metal-binding protein YciE
MPETPTRNAKLIQYLSEAHRKEKELEQSLELHIGMTELPSQRTYKKRLKAHLTETKRHARELERRIKKLGGDKGVLDDAITAASKVAGRGLAAVKGQSHVVRGTGVEEKLLKNAKTEYFNEHEEIATYTALETLAESAGDADTAKLARSIRREEERMARYLEGLIPRLSKAVARAEIPSAERNGGRRRARRRGSSSGRTSQKRTRSAAQAKKRSSSSARSRSSSRSRSSRARTRGRS